MSGRSNGTISFSYWLILYSVYIFRKVKDKDVTTVYVSQNSLNAIAYHTRSTNIIRVSLQISLYTYPRFYLSYFLSCLATHPVDIVSSNAEYCLACVKFKT